MPKHKICLDEDPKSRFATAEHAEPSDDFQRVADERWAQVLATGMTVPWEAARAYLEARARGEMPRRPLAIKAAVQAGW